MEHKFISYIALQSLINNELCQLFYATSGATLEYLPEAVEKLFNRIEELLIARGIPAKIVREVIAKIKAETKLQPFLETFSLLDITRVYDKVAQEFRNDIANLKKTTTNELLAGIKSLPIWKQT